MGLAATKAKNKYNGHNYDRINLVVPKGEKDLIKTLAEQENMSVNSYIYNLIKMNKTNETNETYDFSVFYEYELVADVHVTASNAAVKRYTTHPVKQIFNADNIPRFKLGEILKTRCWDENRDNIDAYLNKIGLQYYDPYKICRLTHGITMHDLIWFRFKGEDFDGVEVLKSYGRI